MDQVYNAQALEGLEGLPEGTWEQEGLDLLEARRQGQADLMEGQGEEEATGLDLQQEERTER